MYEYNIDIVKVIDGDSLWAMIDLGMKIYTKRSIRLYGIDAPELRINNKAGAEARAYLSLLLTQVNKEDDGQIWVRTYKPDKYGRWLAEIFIGDDKESLNDKMVMAGHAEPYWGGKRGS